MSEILILTKQEVDDIKTKLDHIIKIASSFSSTSGAKKIITNDQLISDFGISKKTAQNWRTKGLLHFMQVGRKIYYNLEDVHETLRNHSFDAFKMKAQRHPR